MNVYDNFKLCAYLCVADAYDDATNVYEKYCPLVELLISQKTDKYISINSLIQEFNKIYELKVSRATLNELLNRLSRQGKIIQHKQSIEVIAGAFGRSYNYDKSKKESEISELFVGFSQYLTDNDVLVSPDEVKELLCRFVFQHSYQLFDLLNKATHINKEGEDDFPADFAEHLYDYLMYCRANQKDIYTSFQRLHNGAVQATLLNSNPKKLKDFNDKTLEIEQVVLDSNFIMRVLDLQTEADCLTAKDTLRLLKSKNIRLIVLNETVQEISTTVKNFLDETAPYTIHTKNYYNSKGIKFNGLHAAIQRGKTRTELREYSSQEHIKTVLKDSKIGCEVLDEKCALCNEDVLINSLIEAKGRETYREKQAQHDIALINWCKKRRPRNLSNVKSAKSWVLTNDIKLTYWNKKNTDSDIQECITETQLCHLLWIDEPKDEGMGMISTILALANRNSVNSAELETFLMRAEAYKQRLESSAEVDMFTLAFHSDAITTIDIKNAYSSDSEFENMIKSKARAVKEESRKKDAEIEERTAQTNKAVKELKLSSLENKILALENSNLSVKAKQSELRKEIDEKQSRISTWKKADTKTTRIAALIVVLGCIILLVLGCFLYNFFKQDISKIVEDVVHSFVIRLVFGIAFTFVLYLLSMLITVALGKPFGWKNTFTIIKNKLLQKYGFEDDFSEKDVEEEIEALYEELIDLEKKIAANNAEINTINYDVAVVKNELNL